MSSFATVLALLMLVLHAPRGALAVEPVGTWSVSGPIRFTACAQGRCQTETVTGNDTLTIGEDGRFTFGVQPDPSCPATVPIVGTWTRKPNGTVALRGTNAREVWSIISNCADVGFTIRGRRFAGRLRPDAGAVRFTMPGTARVRGVLVTVTLRATFQAAPVSP